MSTIVARPLEPAGFAPFGDVLRAEDAPLMINEGRCERHDDLARLAFLGAGRARISLFRSEPVTLPYALTLMERHPDGSQAFLPAGSDPWLVTVAPDEGGRPGAPLAFLAAPGVGVNLLAGTWHGALTPLDRPADFWVVDRAGPGRNLEEHVLAEPVTVVAEDG
ncbi:MAG: ureidoglycolate lyase [Pseudomonadota bacterium]